MTKAKALRTLREMAREANKTMMSAPRQYQRIAASVRKDTLTEALAIVEQIEVGA